MATHEDKETSAAENVSTTTSIPDISKLEIQESSETCETTALTQNSPFLILPEEIQQRIYDFVFMDWTFAIFDSPGPHVAHQVQQRQRSIDGTLLLLPVGSKLVSGPPGLELMLTCRDVYRGVSDRYGSGFTRRLVIGKVSRRLQHSLSLFLRRQLRLEKWYWQVRDLSVTINLDIERLSFRMQSVFPGLRNVKILIYSDDHALLERPLHRIAHEVVRGHHDIPMVRQAIKATQAFFGCSREWSERHPWANPLRNRSETTLDVKLVHWTPSADFIVGLNVRWIGNDFDIMTRAVREESVFRYWHRDVHWAAIHTVQIGDQGSSELPEEYC